MNESLLRLQDISDDVRRTFQKRQAILSFNAYLDLIQENPRALIRSAAEYVRDCFDHFGANTSKEGHHDNTPRFKLFDMPNGRGVPIIGGKAVQSDIYRTLQAFARQGIANKVIFLHGPNGSAKSSTIEAISHAMQRYSETTEGAVYRFNWIFPIDRSGSMRTISGESGPIGFSARKDEIPANTDTYAFLDDQQIASKLQSEFKENPFFLLPMPYRETLLRTWLAKKENKRPEDVEIPHHILSSGLSKRNQLIFENLLAAYNGDLDKVLRHVQVERFHYSRQYRIGISTVEPQMSVDAHEKQLTMDKNIANLPPVLHNIRFTEASGEIVEANRGILEFSDLLKRPLEAFKYLLTSVERATLSLPSATQHLDIVFFATSNEKHLDAFKGSPDFSSFRGRFELVTVPYLLSYVEEEQIYQTDIEAVTKSKYIAPHSVECLCLWAVMTRLKHPDPEQYDSTERAVVTRLDPLGKAKLYAGKPLGDDYSPADQIALTQLRSKVMRESVDSVIYEGRFGASPRELKALIYRLAESQSLKYITPMSIFDELERLVKDRTAYEYLQFEPRHKFHDAAHFIKDIKGHFAAVFEDELLASMNLVEDKQYDTLIARYIEHAVASVKKERIFNRKTEQREDPSESLMKNVETILGVSGEPLRFRESLLARIASFSIDNPKAAIDFGVIFSDHLQRLREHYHQEHARQIEDNMKAILALATDSERLLNDKQIKTAQSTLSELKTRFGYVEDVSKGCVKFLLAHWKR